MSRKRWIPVAAQAWPLIGGLTALGLALVFWGPWLAGALGAALLALAVFSLYFFRDPEREIPRTSDILAPADGRVLEVAEIDGEGYGPGRVVRIFLSVFDGHIQRAPVAGRVRDVRYRPGKFLDARDPRASFANESNAVWIDSPRGTVLVRQIAGFIARRIVCWVRPDDTLEAGERIGLIRFGSQVDLYVPPGAEVVLREGQRVKAGVSVAARWTDRPAGRPERGTVSQGAAV